ncbi:hypothetical protein LEP1GSC050_3117 [Leptospira broomii serovar Hurstbridge str. 5399]|uniref:Uncharacterized protein n=1 Tax=Leptospira broomii serovar Hurstbridge str. 5399 TaxID=1049789 RepID=T0GKZ7_9LEPT|nr:hypothetical protein LEP1GSC050_3117 [Leptospira broomii serovar Hurstbridge str. 5399]
MTVFDSCNGEILEFRSGKHSDNTLLLKIGKFLLWDKRILGLNQAKMEFPAFRRA